MAGSSTVRARDLTLGRRLALAALRILGGVAGIIFILWLVVAQPSCRRNRPSAAATDPVRLREHVEMLSERLAPRDCWHREGLERCADYIAGEFGKAGAAVESQSFAVCGKPYRNVIGRFNARAVPRIVVGAHYDACGELPGADDNASGVAALIELAHLLGRQARTCAVDVVAYSLEEPPFFRTADMGSAVHARSLAREASAIRGVIVLEMVGSFSDLPGSQTYPAPLLRLMYPGRANFIGVVSRWDQGDWIKTVKTGMKGATGLPVRSIRAPSFIPGIDYSDHLNYWDHGIGALMITDTAFYRNKAYHTPGDTADRLDYRRMAQVVVAVYEAIQTIVAQPAQL